MFDVAVIGAGVVGSSIARELSRYRLKLCMIEKESDAACGTSKSNSGIVHAGFDAEPGTLMARLNVEGCKRFESLSRELDFSFKKIGSLVVAFNESEVPKLEMLLKRGIENGVRELEILSGSILAEMEPELEPTAVAALYAPAAGITSPYEMNIAMAENAVMNGAQLFTGRKVTGIKKLEDGSFKISAGGWDVKARYIVNAAGLYADEISRMAGAEDYRITARKGEYCLLDKNCGKLVRHVLFQVPGPMGKGVLVTPTVHGNILAGPNAYVVEDKEDLSTTREGLEEVVRLAEKSVPNFPLRDIITSFSGIRAVSGQDFIIENSRLQKGFVNVGGICSPGLTAAPAIATFVCGLLEEQGLKLDPRPDFAGGVKGIRAFREMDSRERIAAIKENPLYGRVICRCEMVTEGEIVEAIHRIIPARDIDAVKRRVRAGMGRCQGGFCYPRITEILSRELGEPMTSITKNGGESFILQGKTR